MAEHTFGVPLTLEETASLDILLRNVIATCGFRDVSDDKIAGEIVKRLMPKDPTKPEAATLQLTLDEGRNLWDLLAAVRCCCSFDKVDGWQFVVEMQNRIHNSAKVDNTWFNIQRILPKPGTRL